MTAAVLKMFRLDPVVSEEELGLLEPWPVPAKIIYERSQIWSFFLYSLVAHPISLFTLNMASIVPRFGGPDA